MENQMQIQEVEKFNSKRKITKKICSVYLIITGLALIWFVVSVVGWWWKIMAWVNFGTSVLWSIISLIVLLRALIDLPRRPRSIVSFLSYGVALAFLSINMLSLAVIAGVGGDPILTYVFLFLPLILLGYWIIFMIFPFKNKNSNVASK